MKLYLLSQDHISGYDTYDSCVVCAKNAEEAKKIHPNGKLLSEQNGFQNSWTLDESKIQVDEIGVANKNVKRGEVICASFNAG
jgi:hypothetical protein